jgi:hypothetical protein
LANHLIASGNSLWMPFRRCAAFRSEPSPHFDFLPWSADLSALASSLLKNMEIADRERSQGSIQEMFG